MKKLFIGILVLVFVVGCWFTLTQTGGETQRFTREDVDGNIVEVYRYYDQDGNFVKEEQRSIVYEV